MVTILLVALATTFTPPEPVDPQNWVGSFDATSALMEGSKASGQRVAIFVDNAGRPHRCVNLGSIGLPKFTGLTCAIMMKRARFKPAKDEAGHSLAGVWTGSFRYGVTRTTLDQPELGQDAVILVQKLPAGILDTRVTIAQRIEADAQIGGCRIVKPSTAPSLDAAACGAAQRLDRPAVDLGEQAGPVIVQQTLRFEQQPPTPEPQP